MSKELIIAGMYLRGDWAGEGREDWGRLSLAATLHSPGLGCRASLAGTALPEPAVPLGPQARSPLVGLGSLANLNEDDLETVHCHAPERAFYFVSQRPL